jgi:hypothetical protein
VNVIFVIYMGLFMKYQGVEEIMPGQTSTAGLKEIVRSAMARGGEKIGACWFPGQEIVKTGFNPVSCRVDEGIVFFVQRKAGRRPAGCAAGNVCCRQRSPRPAVAGGAPTK